MPAGRLRCTAEEKGAFRKSMKPALQKHLYNGLAALVALALSFCPSAAMAEEGDEEQPEPAQAMLEDGDLERRVFAKGCVLIDASDPETLLYAKNPDEPIIPASTTKIMTCILALEMVEDLNSVVAVPDEAASLHKSNSLMGLRRGESLPMIDLLYGLMLPSGNDAAISIACYLAGDVESFAALMNEKAAELGMADTSFATPSGVYRRGFTSTAHDMARLTAYAMQNEMFRKIVSTVNYTVLGNDVRRQDLHLVNSNRLISDPETSSIYYEYAIGAKTGATTVGGKCLVAVAEKDGVMLIASLMGAIDESGDMGWLARRCFIDAKGLFEKAYERLYAFADAETLGCAQIRLDVCAENPRLTDEQDGRFALTADLSGQTAYLRKTDIEAICGGEALLTVEPSLYEAQIVAPIAEGEVLGTVQVSLRGRVLFSAPLLASRAVAAYDPADEPAPAPTVMPETPAAETEAADLNPADIWLCAVTAVVLAALGVALYLRRRRRGA